MTPMERDVLLALAAEKGRLEEATRERSEALQTQPRDLVEYRMGYGFCREIDDLPKIGVRVARALPPAPSGNDQRRRNRFLEKLRLAGLIERHAPLAGHFTHAKLTEAGRQELAAAQEPVGAAAD